MIPHLARRLRFEHFPVGRRCGNAGGTLILQVDQPLGLTQPPPSSSGMYSAKAFVPKGGSRKATSKGSPGVRKKRAAPICKMRPLAAPPKRTSCSCKACAAAGNCSTNTTSRAPRESASRPKAPEPANRSRQRVSAMECCSQLNSVSRTRSGVGRRAGMSGKVNSAAAPPPAMMRTELRPVGAGKSILEVATAGIIPFL